jgi:hypothetical protein
VIYKNIDKILKDIRRKIAQILTKMQRGGGQLTETGDASAKSVKMMTKIPTKF